MATKRKASDRRRRSTSKRGSGKRQLLKGKATFFARRTAKGRFKEMDERGRASATDRRRRAKTTAKPGRGDRGDRKVA